MLTGSTTRRFYLLIVWMALIDALSVVIRFLSFALSHPLQYLLLAFLAGILATVGWTAINHHFTSKLNSTHRDDFAAVYLCGSLGVLLVTIEVVFSVRFLSHFNVVFSYEEFLIGASALFLLVRGIRTHPCGYMHSKKFAGVLLLALGVRVAAMVAGFGSASARYAEIVPAVYMGAGNECAVRLGDEFDGAFTTMIGDDPVGRPVDRLRLAVCARVRDSDEWVVVDGVLDVENVAGEASLYRLISRDSAPQSSFLDAEAVGHVRVTAAFGDMTGSGVIEIVAGR